MIIACEGHYTLHQRMEGGGGVLGGEGEGGEGKRRKKGEEEEERKRRIIPYCPRFRNQEQSTAFSQKKKSLSWKL